MATQELTKEISRLRSENMGNDEIAQRLLYQGYSNADVFDAMTQAAAEPASEQGAMEESRGQPKHEEYHPVHEDISSVDSSRISEVAESIIEDKWGDLVDHVNLIIEWKSSMELKLASMETQIKNLKSEFETLNKAILGKISDTDTVMREVSTDIKALEQVFKKILPGFVENVNELSRITQNLKKK